MQEPMIPWGESELAELRKTVGTLMSPKRYRHTLAVEEMAARLCAVYCPEQTDLLRAAGLLHDTTKELSLEEQMQLCRELGIPLLPGDELSPKVFHAKTGAALIPVRYPQFNHPTVVSAVRWHTTGHEGMTLTEKILYLADYIDESRTFPDCVELRNYFWNAHPENMTESERLAHLRRTLIISLDMTMKGLLEDGAIISVDTALIRNELLREEKTENPQ